MNNIRRAKYVTEWDDGETVLESPCDIDLMSHKIICIGKRQVVQSPFASADLDDYIEVLDKQYVKFEDGTTVDVVDYDERWSFEDKNGMAPFYLGKEC